MLPASVLICVICGENQIAFPWLRPQARWESSRLGCHRGTGGARRRSISRNIFCTSTVSRPATGLAVSVAAAGEKHPPGRFRAYPGSGRPLVSGAQMSATRPTRKTDDRMVADFRKGSLTPLCWRKTFRPMSRGGNEAARYRTVL